MNIHKKKRGWQHKQVLITFISACVKTMNDSLCAFLLYIPVMNMYYFYNQQKGNKILNSFNSREEI